MRLMASTIICAIDESDCARAAARVAADFADRLGLALVAAHAVAPLPVATAGLPYMVPPSDQELESHQRAAASSAELALRSAGIADAPVRTAYGPAAEVLITVAKDEDAAMIAVGSRGSGPLRSLVLGSVTEALVQAGRVPVLAVPPGVGSEFASRADGPVLAAVGGAEDAAWMPVAGQLALAHGGRLMLVHVVTGAEDVAGGAQPVGSSAWSRPSRARSTRWASRASK